MRTYKPMVAVLAIALSLAAVSPAGATVSLVPVGTGHDIYTPTSGYDYRYGPAFIRNPDDTIDMWTCSPGSNGSWDYIRYARSSDDGNSFPNEQVVLQPTTTTGSPDFTSVCDPGVVKLDGYYYLAYTGIGQPANAGSPLVGNPNHLFVARSSSPSGPFDKWNGSGWGGVPAPFISYNGTDNAYGIGEPSLVVKDSTLYIYYSEYTANSNKTLVATARADSPVWPGSVTLSGTAIDRTISGSGIEADIQDTTDHKFVPALGKFIAIDAAKRLTDKSYFQVYESTDGLTYTPSSQITQNLKAFAHNVGITGDELGHLDPLRHNYIGYAYGSTWGQWSTHLQPFHLADISAATVLDQDNSAGPFSNYSDISSRVVRIQPFKVAGTSLSLLNLWLYKAGSPNGNLEIRIYALNGSNQPTGLPLATHIFSPTSVSPTPGWVSISPGLTNLSPGATYGFALSSPGSSAGGGTDAYGWAYSDSNLYPTFDESYSLDGGNSWTSEYARSMKFQSFTAAVSDGDVSAGSYSNYSDVYSNVQRMQTFTASSSTLPELDIWTSRPTANAADLVVRIYAADSSDNPIGAPLYATSINRLLVPESFGWLRTYPNLSGLAVGGKYAFVLSSPGSGSYGYGWGYSDSNPFGLGLEKYSVDGGASWTNESSRDLKFIVYK